MKLLTSSVVIVLSHRQFNDEEYAIVKSRLEAEGCRIKIAATSLQASNGCNGTVVQPQLLLSDIQVSKFQAIVFIGGNGSRDYWDHPRVHNIVRTFEAHGKLLAAICIAPVILAKAGILKDREGTCHPSVMKEFKLSASYRSESVVFCDNVICASGPDAAPVFVEQIIEALSV